MTITRISTASLQQNSLSNVAKVQADLFNLQNQISSQYKSQNFAGLNGQVEQFTAVTSKLSSTQNYLDNNSQVLARIQQTGTALDQLTQIASDVQNLILQRRDPAFNDSQSFQQQMAALRTTFSNAMDTNVQGRYLFSGTKTDTPPVKEPFPTSQQIGVPDDSYYQGSHDDVVAQVDDNYTLKYSVRGDEKGFQDVYAAISQALSGDASGSDDALQKAYTLAQSGVQEINAISTRNNANQVSVQDVNDRHTSLKTYWQGVTDDISKTDLVAASTQVAVDQSVLQATFQVFSQINSLHLADFLK